MSNFTCPTCGLTNIDCGKAGYKTAPEIIKNLKENGFKWAPSQKAWQRQITINGKLAIKRFAEFMETIDDE